MRRTWAGRAVHRLLYRRMVIVLVASDWYEHLSRLTGPGGWQVVRLDGSRAELERRRIPWL